MSMTGDVLKNKNRLEKKQKQLRKEELDKLRRMTVYKAKLADKLQHISVMLDDADVDEVVIKVSDEQLPLFTSCLYTEDMSAYDVRQSESSPNQFYVRKKVVAF